MMWYVVCREGTESRVISWHHRKSEALAIANGLNISIAKMKARPAMVYFVMRKR